MPEKPSNEVQSHLTMLEASSAKPIEVAIGLTLDVMAITVELAEAIAAIANSKVGIDNPELAEQLRSKVGRVAKISRQTLATFQSMSPAPEKGAPT